MDFENVNGKAFHLLIPLQLKDGSPPKFAIMHDGIKAKMHLEYDVALGIGDQTWHGTGEFDYHDSPREMRMTVSLYLGIQEAKKMCKALLVSTRISIQVTRARTSCSSSEDDTGRRMGQCR